MSAHSAIKLILTEIAAILIFPYLLSSQEARTTGPFLGFDRNDYPGDTNLPALRRDFDFTGYWLNVPPGGRSNSWAGKREIVRNAGLGFLVLFNGRLDVELKKSKDPVAIGRSDAASALSSAQKEGFPQHIVIFLDLEEGGRMLPEQKAYVYAWVDEVNASGYQAGVYCSGIAVKEGGGVEIVTAEDLRQNSRGRKIVFWVANDACPPSPGCALPKRPPSPSRSGVGFAEVWQTAQSPRRRDIAGGCRATYDRDGNCYAPGTRSQSLFLDIDVAKTPDPSVGR